MDNRYKKVQDYWNDNNIESMYDKHLLQLEINAIKNYLTKNAKILDAGCGEGEGTFVYASIKGSLIHACDFSDTRLKMAKKRLIDRNNVVFKKVDFLKEYELDYDYDYIVSQRFLINLVEWEQQKKVIQDLTSRLNKKGKLILVEGSQNGTDELNQFRKLYKLQPIGVKWHNLFFDDKKLTSFLKELGFHPEQETGFGTYYLLTRGIQPIFTQDLKWDSEFNTISSSGKTQNLLGIDTRFSRVKLWVFSR
ncbi:MAG: hypothetical protein B6D64_11670 [Bacteroidetes bacterium 4484_276]|nr:MAG: hypothetical protein B6D64_11670 [Bacteroidetes bacterium 4484_276]RLD73351.1 MAG: hypothetical protein DRI87_04165 [Bacteroidota bacterium]